MLKQEVSLFLCSCLRSAGRPAVDVPGVLGRFTPHIAQLYKVNFKKLKGNNLTEEQTVKSFSSLTYRDQMRKEEVNGSLSQKSPSVLDLSASDGKNE